MSPRPRMRCRCRYIPRVRFFKPRGIPARLLREIILDKEELEALKLYEVDDLDQGKAAEKMGVSQPTFSRMLDRAQRKVAKAIVEGYGIRIER